MILKLIVVDQNPKLLSTWSEIFRGIAEVVFMNIDFKTLVRLSEIDAVLMRWIFAHERYGGKPKIGHSQILSTNGENGMPSWVITTPPLPLESTPLPKKNDYTEFNTVFKTIDQFNKTNKEAKIQTLAFEISFLYGFRSELPYKEAEDVQRAYLEYYNNTH